MQGFGNKRTLAIRRDHWKLLNHQGSGGNNYQKSTKLQPFALPNHTPDAAAQLYHLANDPGETTNLYIEQPRVVQELTTLLEDSLRNGRSAAAR